MNGISDILMVTFSRSLDDDAVMCVSRVVDEKIVVLKMELREQADILYHLLTEQTAKAEITQLEKVLEDIKTEIQNEIDKLHNDGTYSYDTSRIGLREALNIIDKHIS